MATTTAPQMTDTTPDRRRIRRSRSLLAGVVAGPVLAAVSFAQIPFRDGFDMTRHAFSFLMLGPGGWLQQANYLLAGALFVLAGPGLRRALGGRTGVVAQVVAACLGTGLVVAGVFPPPPSFGYPVGAPAGVPDQVTATAIGHGIGFGLGAFSLAVLLLVLAGWLRRRSPRWAAVALVVGLAQLSVPVTSGLPYGTVWLYVAVTTGLLTTSVLCYRLVRTAAASDQPRGVSATLWG